MKRSYYQRNREKILEERKEYYKANKQKMLDNAKEYQSRPENKDKIKNYSINYNKKRSIFRSTVRGLFNMGEGI